jgi:diguanylate cyclase (GGDEF)-like protein/PAS domain S-box-containing protein
MSEAVVSTIRTMVQVPNSLLARLRLLSLCLALTSVAALVPAVLQAHEPLALRLVAVVAAFALAGHWMVGYRRARMPMAAEPVEVIAVYLLLRVAPGNPLLPLLGLVFHSLYGRPALAWLRYVLWMGALLAAHAGRGGHQFSGDLARAAGTALVPGFLQIVLHATAGLAASERRLASLVQNSTDVVTVIGDDLLIRWQADSIRRVLGYEPGALLGRPLHDLLHPEDRGTLDGYVADAGREPGLARTLAVRLRHADGRYRDFEVVLSDRSHDESLRGFVLNMRDATERLALARDLQALAAEREHDALHDPLTGLANRRNLFAALDSAIERASARDDELALLLIDLDRFKELNDALGHHVGDQLLREIRPRLRELADHIDLLARLGGDEFAVLVQGRERVAAALDLARLICAALERPFHYEGLTLLIEASIGICVFPLHADDRETLVQRADIAMYAAKRARTGPAFYDAGSDEHSRDRLALLGELPGAIERRELILHYQPKFDLRSGEMCGVEALVRWNHPERGLLFPDAFLPVVEHTGLMRPMTLHIIEESLRQVVRWREAGLSLPVAVNLSAPNLLDAGLPRDVARLLAETGVHASSLQLEITERIMGADPVRMAKVLDGLRAQGITLSLDDFGTGSSSLSYLRELPVQELKIDKSFVRGASAGTDRDAAVVQTIIALAHDLGLRSVAEGIETEADRAMLLAAGCDHGQGFGLGRPMPADDVARMCQARLHLVVGQAAPLRSAAGRRLAAG